MSDALPEADDVCTPEGIGCIRCGYALVALPRAGDCPECGTAIEVSLAGDRIVDADPHWLDMTLRGLGLIHLGIRGTAIAWLVSMAAVIITIAVEALSSHPFWDLKIWSWLGSALAMSMPLGLIASIVGGVLVTTAEPRDAGRERMRDARPLARWGPTAAISLSVVAYAIDTLLGPPNDRIVAFAILTIAAAAGGIGLAALQERLRQIAVRIPSVPLADQCTELQQWYRSKTRLLVGGLVCLIATEALAANQILPGPMGQVVTLIPRLVVSITLLAACLKFWNLSGTAGALRTEIREARATAAPD